jgi:hypothetical protein
MDSASPNPEGRDTRPTTILISLDHHFQGSHHMTLRATSANENRATPS